MNKLTGNIVISVFLILNCMFTSIDAMYNPIRWYRQTGVKTSQIPTQYRHTSTVPQEQGLSVEPQQPSAWSRFTNWLSGSNATSTEVQSAPQIPKYPTTTQAAVQIEQSQIRRQQLKEKEKELKDKATIFGNTAAEMKGRLGQRQRNLEYLGYYGRGSGEEEANLGGYGKANKYYQDAFWQLQAVKEELNPSESLPSEIPSLQYKLNNRFKMLQTKKQELSNALLRHSGDDKKTEQLISYYNNIIKRLEAEVRITELQLAKAEERAQREARQRASE